MSFKEDLRASFQGRCNEEKVVAVDGVIFERDGFVVDCFTFFLEIVKMDDRREDEEMKLNVFI